MINMYRVLKARYAAGLNKPDRTGQSTSMYSITPKDSRRSLFSFKSKRLLYTNQTLYLNI